MATAPTTPPRQSWQFGRIYTPDEAWLATAPPEPIIEPDLPIVDPHHHLWLRGGHPYLLDELLADLNTGHNVVATVFEECHSMYRAHGAPEMRAVGETEFVAGIAAMSDSGNYGPTRVAELPLEHFPVAQATVSSVWVSSADGLRLNGWEIGQNQLAGPLIFFRPPRLFQRARQ